MDEQLQQALADIIQRATTGIDSAAAFLSAELPDVVYQLLMWYSVKSALLCVLGILFILPVTLLLASKWEKGEPTQRGYDGRQMYHPTTMYDVNGMLSDLAWVCLCASTVAAVIGVIIISHNMDWLQILIAPKIWLIEYAAHLVK